VAIPRVAAGEYFTIRDVTDAIASALNLRLEGCGTGAFCDTAHMYLEGISRVSPGQGISIWDLTPPERDPVLAVVMRRAKTLAFSMGIHPRLGAEVRLV
jgi:hypothetical protein